MISKTNCLSFFIKCYAFIELRINFMKSKIKRKTNAFFKKGFLFFIIHIECMGHYGVMVIAIDCSAKSRMFKSRLPFLSFVQIQKSTFSQILTYTTNMAIFVILRYIDRVQFKNQLAKILQVIKSMNET